MTGICGLIGRNGDDLQSKVRTILSLMRTRGPTSQAFSQESSNGETIVIGICGSVHTESFSRSAIPLALDGVFFGDEQGPHNPAPPGPGRLIQTPGAFAFLTSLQDRLIAGRDIIGQKPLYFGRIGDDAVAFASMSSPLVSIGIPQPEPVPPGKVIRASARGHELLHDYSL
jgi:asparagine synthetase B (glutamine-hydrolysing)